MSYMMKIPQIQAKLIKLNLITNFKKKIKNILILKTFQVWNKLKENRLKK